MFISYITHCFILLIYSFNFINSQKFNIYIWINKILINVINLILINSAQLYGIIENNFSDNNGILLSL